MSCTLVLTISLATQKALNAKKAALKGVHQSKALKVRTNTSFRQPKTLSLPRAPKYQRKSVAHYPRLDEFKIIKNHVNSEVSIKKIEQNNTLVVTVDIKANKNQIKSAIKKLYDVEVAKVNTLIRPDGSKKAFVRLTPDHDALDVASRVGYI